MKAIIPVAGAGTTLRPHTHTQPKPLIPVAGKPILGHIVDRLQAAGVTEFVFVVGYLGEKIRQFVTATLGQDLPYHFVEQEPREGLAHAVWVAREHLSPNQPVVIALGDTIVDTDLTAMFASPENELGVQPVREPGLFGIAVLGEDQRITQLIEKPQIPTSNLALVGVYKLADGGQLRQALQHLMDNNLRTRGEYQLTDALNFLVQNGETLRARVVEQWYDCGKKDILLATNRVLLDRRTDLPAYDFPRAILHPPVYIAEGVTIEDAVIGPYVAIAENATIRNSVVTNSILGAYSELNRIVLDESVVGNDTRLTGRRHRINIGDNTEIDFNN